jgi:hypothetical protein
LIVVEPTLDADAPVTVIHGIQMERQNNTAPRDANAQEIIQRRVSQGAAAISSLTAELSSGVAEVDVEIRAWLLASLIYSHLPAICACASSVTHNQRAGYCQTCRAEVGGAAGTTRS